MPFSAPMPLPTINAVGVASPKAQGQAITSTETAVIKAGAVRFRPIVLTAAALVVGGAVILLDPIFQGLATALISGVVVATLLTLVVIPLLYYMYLKTIGPEKVVQIEGREV